MKYKVTEFVLDYEKKPIKEIVEEADKKLEKLLTWKMVIHYALNTKIIGDENLTKEKIMMCYGMTKMAFEEKEPEFSIEEVAFLLERIRKTYKPLVVGRAEEFFNKKIT